MDKIEKEKKEAEAEGERGRRREDGDGERKEAVQKDAVILTKERVCGVAVGGTAMVMCNVNRWEGREKIIR